MKIIVLSSNTSWYLFNFRSSTIKVFLQQGYTVVCISPPDAYSDALTTLGCQWLSLDMDNQGNNPLRDLKVFWQFYRYYRRLKPVACFHFTIKNNIYGTWAALLAGVPAINNVSGMGTAFIRKGLVSMIVRGLYKLSQPFAYRVYCQNAEDYQLLIDHRLVPAGRLKLLPGSGVNLQRFHPDLCQGSHQPLRFLYAGRFLADKGLYELITALDNINQQDLRCQLWLCGFSGVKNVSAIPDQVLQQWQQRPDINWLGSTDQIQELYAQVDCVVLPSYREGMPRTLLEAGAMGLPVIATNVPGCRNIVTDGDNGLLCEARDIDSLQAAMQAMLAISPEQRQSMGAVGRRRVEQDFDEALVVNEALAVVAEITGNKSFS